MGGEIAGGAGGGCVGGRASRPRLPPLPHAPPTHPHAPPTPTSHAGARLGAVRVSAYGWGPSLVLALKSVLAQHTPPLVVIELLPIKAGSSAEHWEGGAAPSSMLRALRGAGYDRVSAAATRCRQQWLGIEAELKYMWQVGGWTWVGGWAWVGGCLYGGWTWGGGRGERHRLFAPHGPPTPHTLTHKHPHTRRNASQEGKEDAIDFGPPECVQEAGELGLGVHDSTPPGQLLVLYAEHASTAEWW